VKAVVISGERVAQAKSVSKRPEAEPTTYQ